MQTYYIVLNSESYRIFADRGWIEIITENMSNAIDIADVEFCGLVREVYRKDDFKSEDYPHGCLCRINRGFQEK